MNVVLMLLIKDNFNVHPTYMIHVTLMIYFFEKFCSN